MDEVTRRVREIAGEHCVSFVFIGTIEHDDESRTVISDWEGDLNSAIGLAERMKERLRQKIIEIDFPDGETPGEDWKESGA